VVNPPLPLSQADFSRPRTRHPTQGATEEEEEAEEEDPAEGAVEEEEV